MSHFLAQTPLGNITGIGPLGTVGASGADTFGAKFTRVVSITLGTVTVAAGIWFIVQFFSAAFVWLASGGDKQQIENAKKRIAHSLIGLFIVIFGYTVIGLVGLILGIDIINLENAIRNLTNFGSSGGGGGGAVPTIPIPTDPWGP
jgi:hypothetical protein